MGKAWRWISRSPDRLLEGRLGAAIEHPRDRARVSQFQQYLIQSLGTARQVLAIDAMQVVALYRPVTEVLGRLWALGQLVGQGAAHVDQRIQALPTQQVQSAVEVTDILASQPLAREGLHQWQAVDITELGAENLAVQILQSRHGRFSVMQVDHVCLLVKFG